ncbi:relaxase/mobilization nuclease domain-containing protein [Riemerella columbipharyngis]|uniref:Relaxase/Mobilisation nuclease domain-containing protein n=1 Tax=Riemerella columbipharyngis TaxID=1071918 RepID=A0A1G7FRL1_9FLAO|nr:relaxase/mobilization nuclease domain-containing protein [Riemerella columbipharyngis]SDE78498.1 Relaxase/Mobilisation nuclease domain-containing protein [Riemerella columbipharyngis]
MVTKAKSVKGSLSAAHYKEKGEKNAVFLCQNKMDAIDYRERYEEMKLLTTLYKGRGGQKPFIEQVISPSVSLTDDELRELALEYAQKMGFENHQWYAVAHRNTAHPHIHLIANRVGFDGKLMSDSFIGDRSGKVAEQIAKKRGWKQIRGDQNKALRTAISKMVYSIFERSTSWEEAKEKAKELRFYFKTQERNGEVIGLRIMPYLKEEEEKSKIKEYNQNYYGYTLTSLQDDISNSENGYKLSELDRKLKVKDLNKLLINNQIKKGNERRKQETAEQRDNIERSVRKSYFRR